jgi:YD repeat-containing protein
LTFRLFEVLSQVIERSDWANRLIAAQQQCSYPGEATWNYDWAFIYDSLGNKLRQTDPLYHPTTQLFDGLGRLQEVKLPEIHVTENGDTAPTEKTPAFKYGYDLMGNKTSETDARGNTVNYDYDLLGRLIRVTTTSTRMKDLKTGATETVTAVTKTYYDAAGNKVQTTDANNHSWFYTYSARGFLLSEKDPEGNLTQYRYDPMGNKIAVIDPRNKEAAPNTWYKIVNQKPVISDPRTNKSFTTWFVYDNLGRLARTILPDKKPPVNPYTAEEDNPYTRLTYYADGNKETERDATGLATRYTYTPRGWVETVSVGGQLKVRYVYDAKGNQKEIRRYYDASNYTSTMNFYDSLDRLREVTYPGNVVEKYTYDAVGNRKTVTAGTNNSTTVYDYNPLSWLTRVQDPLYNATEYWYDLNGNQVAQISPNQLKTVNYYDELNRLRKQKDSLGNLTKFSYDDAGNRWKMLDRRGTEWKYEYYKNNALRQVTLTGDGPAYQVTYEYDEAGNRTRVTDNGNINIYGYDEQSRLTDVERRFDEATYTTGYQYTNQRLSGIMYPEARNWLEYKYNDLNQVNEVAGFTLQNGITYDGDGAVNGMKYQNEVTVSYTYNTGRRLMDLVATAPKKELMKNHYQYWENSTNIKYINDKYYEYDKNNQLTKAVTPGKFLEDKVTPGSAGVFTGDILGTNGLMFSADQRAIVRVDTNSTSIGLDFGTVASGVKKILFVPDQGH